MNQLTLKVNNALEVRILPSQQHQFLMTTNEIAIGYGVSVQNIREHKRTNSDELLYGKHFISADSFSDGRNDIKHNATLWTKRGIVRLGFFIKSERAKMFRDWAEDLIIYASEQNPYIEMEARIQALETRLMEAGAVAQPTFDELVDRQTEFFAQWLRWGDVQQVAAQSGISRNFVNQVKVGKQKSRRVSALLYDVCIRNRREMENKNQTFN